MLVNVVDCVLVSFYITGQLLSMYMYVCVIVVCLFMNASQVQYCIVKIFAIVSFFFV